MNGSAFRVKPARSLCPAAWPDLTVHRPRDPPRPTAVLRMVPGMSDTDKKRNDNQDINDWMRGRGNPILLAVGVIIVVGFIFVSFGL